MDGHAVVILNAIAADEVDENVKTWTAARTAQRPPRQS